MNLERAKITGVVLAGGRALRMGGEDKGLMLFKGRPLVTYSLAALQCVAGTILINANRNLQRYAEFGFPVMVDSPGCYQGPLAGLLSAMKMAQTPYVLTVPCDSPMIEGIALVRLYQTLTEASAEICAAHDGKHLHPVFLIARRSLSSNLETYLAHGGRKVESWLQQHQLVLADFSDHPGLFENINTPEQLAAWENSMLLN